MKKALQGLVFVVCSWWGMCGAVSVDTAYVTSEYSSPDSIRISLIAGVTIGGSPCHIYSIELNDSTNRISIKVCYESGSLTVICPRRDTFDLGVRHNAAIEILAVFQNVVYDPTQCIGSNVYKDTFTFAVNTALENLFEGMERSFIISPNPIATTLTLQSSTSFPPQTNFILFDLTGRMVLEQTLLERSERIDISGLSKGMYLYSVIAGSERLGAGKVVLE